MNRSILISIISYLCFFNGAFASFQMDKLSHSLESIEYIEKTDFRSESVNTRVRFIVIHYTSSNWEQSLKILTKADYEVSSHYLIPESFDESYNLGLKIILAISTVLVVGYFIYPSILLKVVSSILIY